MRITMTSTPDIVELNGQRCRVWEGITDRAVRVRVYVAAINVDERDDPSSVAAELEETPAPEVVSEQAAAIRAGWPHLADALNSR